MRCLPQDNNTHLNIIAVVRNYNVGQKNKINKNSEIKTILII